MTPSSTIETVAAATLNKTDARDRDEGGDATRVADVQALLARLRHSAFRAKFHLGARELTYARSKGRPTIAQHARELLYQRVGDAEPLHDGQQTPYRGHPVFVAQHATATCCRGCIAKWHGISKGQALTATEVDRLADVVLAWIDNELRVDVRRSAVR